MSFTLELIHFVNNFFISRFNIVFIFLILFGIVSVVTRLYKYYILRKNLNKIPGPECANVFTGNLPIVLSGVNDKAGVDLYQAFFQALTGLCVLYEKQRIFRFWLGYQPVVCFFKPETVEAILASNTTIDKSEQYGLLKPWLGLGLLTSGGDKWRSRRKMLTPSFHFRILEDFLPVMNEHTVVLIDLLNQNINLNDGIVDDITPYITRCALDIICETAMGIKMNSQTIIDSPYVKAIHETGELFLHRLLRPWLINDLVYSQTSNGKLFNKNMKILHSFTDKVIKDRKLEKLTELSVNKNEIFAKNEETGQKRRMAFLDSLLSEHFKNKDFTELDIREEVDTFMFEGHDTTSMAISWTLHLIGLNPDIQNKCHEELDNIFNADDSCHSIEMNDLREMKYIEACIKEALRLFPSVPFIARISDKEFVINGHKIPKGITCLVFLYEVHRDQQYFPEPEIFRPERFLDNNHMKLHPFSYVPFSAGPRNCIGQKFALLEEKAILATILRNFNIESLDCRDKVKVAPELVMRPKTPIRMRFTSRNSI